MRRLKLRVEKFALGDDVTLGGQGDGGPLVESALIGVVRVTPMQHEAVVPHYYVADLPLMLIRELWARREPLQAPQNVHRCFGLHTSDTCHRPRVEVQGLAARDRMNMDEGVRDWWGLLTHVFCERPRPLLVTCRPPPEVIKHGALSFNCGLEIGGQRRVRKPEIRPPRAAAAIIWNLDAIEHRAGRRTQDVRLIGVPFEIARASQANVVPFPIVQV